MKRSRITGFGFLLLASLTASHSWAANSVLLWPIDPKIASDEKATELWMENRGDSTTLMQVRVFLWQQQDGQDRYQTQQQVLASPPMVRIEPGKKQLIRLVKQTPVPAGEETAFRILIDEIPTPQPQNTAQNQAGLNFQMRYTVPLFVYGNGASATSSKPQLAWQLVNKNGHQALEVTNSGSGHARLSHVSLGGRSISDSLLGYVLPHSSNTFPLSFSAAANAELSAQLSDKTVWRGRSSR
ncbi:protein CsuC [Pantoea coffeiphila]|uniref:Protein CsuC n=2 Tax=Pantoea coffeiphila TaxID=1465635 RepID=A0A2S9IDC2_9GAMM|nr:molecular chaperone [Pantoea coffeiphila]PRD15786.1 protein CsuC [Pantoea coffeiphila]